MENQLPGMNVHLMEEAEQTLRAIRDGAVDAFVVQELEGHRVYTLEGSDLPYSTLVERMQQGAAMLDASGFLVYANLSLAQLLGVEREKLIGLPLTTFLAPEDHPTCLKLIREAQVGSSEGELHLHRGGDSIPAHVSLCLLSRDKSAIGVLISDLTSRKEQGELAARFQRMQDDERKRIARELHDSVGQLLAAIGMNISVVQLRSHKLDAEAARAVSENAMLVEQVSREIRTISHLLHPPLLDVAGLVSALRWYVDGFSERSKIKVDLDIPSDFGRLPDEVEIAIFRIVQECLTNIHRHSGSDSATISLTWENDGLTVQVKDNGKGIPKDRQRELLESGRAGIGFGGMRERLRQLNGSLDIQSEGRGTTVIAKLKVA
ncbi:MAG TPA: PAS domain-containing sensor histidine kinase [Candidatus Deferrimicrobiaceae bacterium]|jgi:PAS domain S-box-containing protein|nr:PAS domain-containing sensor histidine kinase [Candidatus Deferrimicrobiaceae bacterium]